MIVFNIEGGNELGTSRLSTVHPVFGGVFNTPLTKSSEFMIIQDPQGGSGWHNSTTATRWIQFLVFNCTEEHLPITIAAIVVATRAHKQSASIILLKTRGTFRFKDLAWDDKVEREEPSPLPVLSLRDIRSMRSAIMVEMALLSLSSGIGLLLVEIRWEFLSSPFRETAY